MNVVSFLKAQVSPVLQPVQRLRPVLPPQQSRRVVKRSP